MSGRNSRIVRNRERNEKRININFESGNIKIIASIVSIVVILIIVVAIVFSKFKNTNKNQVIATDQIDSYEYFLLYSNDNVGIIDKKGNEIIEPKYEQIYIPNPEKDVFFCFKNDDEYEILNKDGNKLFEEYEEVSIIKISKDTDETEKKVLKYKKNDLLGLIDLDGKIITEAEYTEISSLKDKPGAILVKKDDKYGVLNSSGDIVIENEYDAISGDTYCSEKDLYEKTGYIVSKKDENGLYYGYIDYKGNVLLDVKYESINRALEYDSDDIYLIAMQKGKKGVFKNNKKIIDFNFQTINYSDFSNIFVVEKNGKFGVYSNNGKIILKPEYNRYSIAGEYISVEKENEKQLYDVNGNLVNSSGYTKMIETENPSFFIAENEDGYFSIISKDINIDKKYTQVSYAYDNYFIFTDENDKTGVINALTDEIEIEPKYDFIIVIEGTKALQAIDGLNNNIDIYSKNLNKTVSLKDSIVNSLDNGYAIIYSETDMKYINEEGEVVENTDVYPDQKIYAIQKNGKWGFAQADGKTALDCEYDIVTELNDFGFAGIKKDGKWGVVDSKGKIILEPTYELETYYFPQFIGKYILQQYENTIYCEEI